MRAWRRYRNGNYMVYINLEDGTKIRILDEDEETFKPEFPEGCDILISTKCDKECPFCYAGCTSDGKHGDLPAWRINSVTPSNFLFEPYTEVSINVNSPFHPQLEEFLTFMNLNDVIVNMTINQDYFIENAKTIWSWQLAGLVKGVGVSYTGRHDDLPYLMNESPNRVLHVIEGILTKEDHEYLKQFAPKLLILGYKYKQRGRSYMDSHREEAVKNSQWLKNNLEEIINSYPVISFDNSALEHLHVKQVIGDELFKKVYMGDEGEFTFAMDLVNGVYAQSSQDFDFTSKPIGTLTPTEMFKEVQRELV